MMTQKSQAVELASAHPSFERGSARKFYESPRLRDWGSIVELTGGPRADTQDDDFSGSGAL